MKTSVEYDAFTNLVDRVLAVPHSVIQQRVEEHRKQAALNPNRPGPKPKQKRKAVKPSAS
ncbi:MAG: hypothetical protein LAP61_18660 [Acidobacteriia bacterium]|nr:hypothetical protein [Terriglobia bacterium]